MYALTRKLTVAALTVVVLANVGSAIAQQSRRNPVVEAAAKARPAVVSINVTNGSESKTVGTGVIVDDRGIVITNCHVVGNLKQVTVVLHDRTELQGNVVMADAANDLAAIRVVAGKRLPFLTLAPVCDLEVGETVIAIGNPLGYTGSVTVGIVSALGRKIQIPAGELCDLIQTDASINPGNSGGALLNINGELIGINVAIREDAQGIAFAINAATVQKVLSQQLRAEIVSKTSHGMKCVEVASSTDRQKVVIQNVSGAAAKAGLKKGDILVHVGSIDLVNRFDLERAIWGQRVGAEIPATVIRGGQTTSVTIILESAAATTDRQVASK